MWFEARLVQNNTVQEQSLPGKGQLKDLSELLRSLRHVLILKTCFDVANIIVSYIIFEKPLDYITTRRNIHN